MNLYQSLKSHPATARVMGLGMTATLALALSAAPVLAWADEADEPMADAGVVAQADIQPEEASTAVEALSPSEAEATPVETPTDITGAAGEEVSAPDVPDVETAGAPEEVPVTAQGFETLAEDAVDEGDGTHPIEGDPATVEDEQSDGQAEDPTTASTSAPITEPAASTEPTEPVTYSNMYRLYNPWTGEHLYTASLDEAKSLAELGWRWEGVGWVAPSEGVAVYRLYNPYSGDHHFTTDRSEYEHLGTIGWNKEGIGWRSDTDEGVAVYREFNPYEEVGTHNYTTSAEEDVYLGSIGWRREGVGWYGSNVAALPIEGFWLETGAWGNGSQLYWVDSAASVAKGRYVDPSSARDAGAGHWAYATPETGAVVRGTWYDGGGHVYLADGMGMLADASSGWLVTGAYDNGTVQRYRMDGYGRSKTGEFTVDGRSYFGRTDTGYVARGTWFDGAWRYIADDEGVIQSKVSRKEVYVTWAMDIAADDSHGYSQINRWGPDYDCSALVISALRQAGYETGAANSTRDMRSELLKYGWEVIEPNRDNLQYGDILLHDGVHTAIWCGDGMLVEAYWDENHGWWGTQQGDQTGDEIRVRSYYDDGWLCYLRHA